MRTLAVFVLVWSVCATASSGGVTCNEKEKQALLAFKQALSSDPSGALSSWSLDVRDSACCHWTGVRCNNMTGRVVGLDLSHLNLMGNLTPSLLDLKFLSYLDLSFNNFGGSPIPSFLGSMTSLAHLDLSNTRFEGLIPHQLQNLSSIRYLNLAFNDGLDADNLNWIAHLRALEYLDMSEIDLSREVDWLRGVSSLPSLLELYLLGCQLENMTPSLEHINFTSLTSVDLSANNFNCEIPKWLFNLSSLQNLHLAYNSLYGFIPYEVGQFKHLQVLELLGNKLNGQIPESLGNLSSLEVLSLAENHLNGTLPKSIWVLSNLENLEIDNNRLEGIVTEANLSKLSKLRTLDLSGNSFSFNISSIWVPSFQLIFLFLSSCKIGPSFPLWLKTQTSLAYLDISKTGISDTLPHWFWDIDLYLGFNLSENQIDGDLSPVLLNSEMIDISNNKFIGKLPHISSAVRILNIANNTFSGPISTLLCQKKSKQNGLEVLDVSYNLLSGKLSNCWMNWQSLSHVNLGNNNLSGEIPILMGSLSKLQSLQLHNNKFFGYIPSSLKNCQFLGLINMGGNELTGTIPSWLGQIPNLLVLYLNSNKFTGNIPLHICNLSSLIVLDLGNNNLVGSIPECLSDVTEMVATDKSSFNTLIYLNVYGYMVSKNQSHFTAIYQHYMKRLSLVTKGRKLEYKEILPLVRSIDLSSNRLSGSIPSKISSLVGLCFLNLSHNQLVGKLPENLGNMKMLKSLDVSRNHLSGEIPQSISTLTSLNNLNLSFNNLSGRIPVSTQLQSFNECGFMGNQGLCGAPLKINCTDQQNHPDQQNDQQNYPDLQNYPRTTFAIHKDVRDSEMFWFFVSMIYGFIIGFWGVCGTLLLKKTWRHAYFQFIENMKNHIYVIAILTMNWMHRRFERSTDRD